MEVLGAEAEKKFWSSNEPQVLRDLSVLAALGPAGDCCISRGPVYIWCNLV